MLSSQSLPVADNVVLKIALTTPNATKESMPIIICSSPSKTLTKAMNSMARTTKEYMSVAIMLGDFSTRFATILSPNNKGHNCWKTFTSKANGMKIPALLIYWEDLALLYAKPTPIQNMNSGAAGAPPRNSISCPKNMVVESFCTILSRPSSNTWTNIMKIMAKPFANSNSISLEGLFSILGFTLVSATAWFVVGRKPVLPISCS